MQNFIQSHLLTKTGNFNNRVIDKKWWTIRNLESIYTEIFSTTNFLPESVNLTQRAWHISSNIYKIPECIECGKSAIFINYKSGYSDYCSNECSIHSSKRITKIKNTNLERYGVTCTVHAKHIKEKIIQETIQKHGVQYITQSENFKEKSKLTKKERYDDIHYNNQSKAIETNLDRYGVMWIGQAQSVIDKIQESKSKALPELRSKDWLIEQNKTKNITKIAQELNVTPRTVYLWMVKHDIDWTTHHIKEYKEQKEIYDYITQELQIYARYNDRKTINPRELDIYIPKHNIAIELNGMYFHQEHKTKHISKLELCLSKNIKLLQFWDHQWLFNKDICKSIIRNHLGLNKIIYARKCNIIELDNETYKRFMDNNHIQGYAATSKRYGLMYNNTLVSAIGFSKSRYDKSYDWELIRYANILDTNVVGGFSRLLKHSKLVNIISYSDRMLFTGQMYLKSGFAFIKHTKPGFFYFKGYKIRSREHFQKHKLMKNLENYDPNKSAADNIYDANWRKVWNCGNSVWSFGRCVD
jgi:hypothetical protein